MNSVVRKGSVTIYGAPRQDMDVCGGVSPAPLMRGDGEGAGARTCAGAETGTAPRSGAWVRPGTAPKTHVDDQELPLYLCLVTFLSNCFDCTYKMGAQGARAPMVDENCFKSTQLVNQTMSNESYRGTMCEVPGAVCVLEV